MGRTYKAEEGSKLSGRGRRRSNTLKHQRRLMEEDMEATLYYEGYRQMERFFITKL